MNARRAWRALFDVSRIEPSLRPAARAYLGVSVAALLVVSATIATGALYARSEGALLLALRALCAIAVLASIALVRAGRTRSGALIGPLTIIALAVAAVPLRGGISATSCVVPAMILYAGLLLRPRSIVWLGLSATLAIGVSTLSTHALGARNPYYGSHFSLLTVVILCGSVTLASALRAAVRDQAVRELDALRARSERSRAREIDLRLGAEAQSKARAAFLAVMSHELRTPLNAVLGYADLIDDDLSEGDPIVEDAARVARAGRELLELIDAVLDLSRIEADKMPWDRAPMRLTSAVTAAIERLGPELGVRIDPAPIPAPWCARADEHRAAQAIACVLRHALRASGARARLEVRRAPSGFAVRIESSGLRTQVDLGRRLFEPFTPLGRSGGASGIELALAHALVTRMGGGIEAGLDQEDKAWIELSFPEAPSEPKGEPDLQEAARQVGEGV